MSHCYWSIYSYGKLDKGMQTGELFSMSHSKQQQQPQHNDATNARDDEFDFASIFTDDPSWLASIPCIPSSSSPTAQLAAVVAEAMSPGSVLSALLERGNSQGLPTYPPSPHTASIKGRKMLQMNNHHKNYLLRLLRLVFEGSITQHL